MTIPKGALEQRGVDLAGMYWCSRCHQHKPETNFATKGKTEDGLAIRRGFCRSCEKQAKKNRRTS